MAVCRAWRRVAITCTPLWSTLKIGNHADHLLQCYNRCWKYSYKDLELTTPVGGRKAIRRSRGGPLNVHLGGVMYFTSCKYCFNVCVDQAGQQIERWQSLTFAFSSFEPPLVDIWPMLAGPLPYLHSVSITYYSFDLIAVLSARAPRLHTVELAQYAPDSHSFALGIGKELWPRIRTLKLGYSWFMSGQSNDYLSSLLAACPTLHSLELDDIYTGNTGNTYVLRLPNAWPPAMPKLTRTRCYLRVAAWALLSGMTITVLHIDVLIPGQEHPDWDVGEWRHRKNTKIYLPKLKHLTCHRLPTSLWAVGLFDAPSIVDLVMVELSSYRPSFTDAKDLEKALKHSSLRPRNVSLHWVARQTDDDPGYLLLFLRYLPDILCLTLHGNLPHYSKTLAQPQAQKMCPRLEHIAWYFLSDQGDVEWLQNNFYNTARNGFGGSQTHWTVECLSEAEHSSM
jgi:hypothetical protein